MHALLSQIFGVLRNSHVCTHSLRCQQTLTDLLMIGMLVVLLTTGLWLALATFLELPVSTSHSVGQLLVQRCRHAS